MKPKECRKITGKEKTEEKLGSKPMQISKVFKGKVKEVVTIKILTGD